MQLAVHDDQHKPEPCYTQLACQRPQSTGPHMNDSSQATSYALPLTSASCVACATARLQASHALPKVSCSCSSMKWDEKRGRCSIAQTSAGVALRQASLCTHHTLSTNQGSFLNTSAGRSPVVTDRLVCRSLTQQVWHECNCSRAPIKVTSG